MNIFYTSDTHFGHARIIELCNRPFENVEHMNAEIVRRWNAVVEPTDHVYHLGDVALGHLDDSLPIVNRLNGYKILVGGNHDRPFMNRGKARYSEWLERYREVFDEVIDGNVQVRIGHTLLNASHFPYDGDSHDGDRFVEARPADNGLPLIHGHTHRNQKVSRSQNGSLQIHVGQDAWDFTPVSEDEIAALMEGS